MVKKLFGYAGGQGNIVTQILELLPEHRTYVEVFGGSATVLFSKDPSKIEVLNDINGDIANLFMVVQKREEMFKRKLKHTIFSRHLYNEWHAQLKTGKVIHVGFDVDRAVKFFYVFNCGFTSNPIPSVFSSSVNMNKAQAFSNRVDRTLDIIHERIKQVSIENMDFRKLIKRYDAEGTFFFLDPPYFAPTVNLYEHNLSIKDHGDLCRSLKAIDGKFLLTYDNVKAIRVMYKKFYQVKVDSVVSLTHRHDKTGKYLGDEHKAKQVHLFIANYDIEDGKFDQFATATRLRHVL